MGRTAEPSPGSSRSTAEPTGGVPCRSAPWPCCYGAVSPSAGRAVGRVAVGDVDEVDLGSDGMVERDDLLDLFRGGDESGHRQGPPRCGQRHDHRPRQKEDSITVGTSRLAAVQDGGARGVHDVADRLKAQSGDGLGFESVGVHHRECRGVETGVGEPPNGGPVPSPRTHRAGCTGRTGCPAVRRLIKRSAAWSRQAACRRSRRRGRDVIRPPTDVHSSLVMLGDEAASALTAPTALIPARVAAARARPHAERPCRVGGRRRPETCPSRNRTKTPGRRRKSCASEES